MRDRYLEAGPSPSIRSLGKLSGVPVMDIITSGEFYEMAAGGQIIFT